MGLPLRQENFQIFCCDAQVFLRSRRQVWVRQTFRWSKSIELDSSPFSLSRNMAQWYMVTLKRNDMMNEWVCTKHHKATM